MFNIHKAIQISQNRKRTYKGLIDEFLKQGQRKGYITKIETDIFNSKDISTGNDTKWDRVILSNRNAFYIGHVILSDDNNSTTILTGFYKYPNYGIQFADMAESAACSISIMKLREYEKHSYKKYTYFYKSLYTDPKKNSNNNIDPFNFHAILSLIQSFPVNTSSEYEARDFGVYFMRDIYNKFIS